MSARMANASRPAVGYDIEGAGPLQQAHSILSSPYASSPAPYIQQMQAQQPRSTMPLQQRPQSIEQQQQQQQQRQQQQQQRQQQVMARSAQAALGASRQIPATYLQSQALRQRQATAAANYALQQEQRNAQMLTQRLGSAILRLLNYSEQMNSFSGSSNLAAWKQFVDTFFIDPALCTVSLPIDPALSYELPTPLLPNYFYQLHKEVAKMALTFHDAKEYYVPPASHVVVCPAASLCYYFPNETKVEMLGRLKVVFSPGSPHNTVLKIENMEFVGETWEEWVCRQPPLPNRIARGETQQGSEAPSHTSGQDKKREAEKASPQASDEGTQEAQHRDKSANDESEHNDLEDLFGRSPSASVPAPSPPRSHSSEKMNDPKQVDIVETSKDIAKRKRMVMHSGVTLSHKRLLEISDVLGQLSPLFGRKNPRKALEDLLATLPPPPEEDVKPSQQLSGEDKIANQSRQEAERDQDKPASDDQRESQSAASEHISAQTMQQQASEVLQKQAAQTLSLALPPPNFDFGDTHAQSSTAEDQDDTMDESDHLFAPLGLGSDETEHHNGSNETILEPKEEPDADGEFDLDLDAFGEHDPNLDKSLDFGLDPMHTSHSSITSAGQATSKREGDEILGRGKRAKKSDEEQTS